MLIAAAVADDARVRRYAGAALIDVVRVARAIPAVDRVAAMRMRAARGGAGGALVGIDDEQARALGLDVRDTSGRNM